MATITFTLVGRSYCHLCDDMLQALHKLCADETVVAANGQCTVEQIDVDDDPELVALYDELVPVLIGNKEGQYPVQLCHYFLDHETVSAFLRTSRA
ncbi:glutaredoxin family protein [Glaciimonas sp. PAMC28666]|uniref:glutaredoxin family protein n=1 Tax=Glaciimonas sp. PAMC28666 TaxID=2807626 RepID=UPI0019638C37|nr:glutaredoxin family protein [Glaciimonas sp. PAMC28666]QRX83337.1 glutaredoxin family protein [Glaciimonas sp. PAMC28666]